MNRSQLMGLESVGIDIYDIHEYFLKLTIGQQTPRFWDVIDWYWHQSLGIRTPRA